MPFHARTIVLTQWIDFNGSQWQWDPYTEVLNTDRPELSCENHMILSHLIVVALTWRPNKDMGSPMGYIPKAQQAENLRPHKSTYPMACGVMRTILAGGYEHPVR